MDIVHLNYMKKLIDIAWECCVIELFDWPLTINYSNLVAANLWYLFNWVK